MKKCTFFGRNAPHAELKKEEEAILSKIMTFAQK